MIRFFSRRKDTGCRFNDRCEKKVLVFRKKSSIFNLPTGQAGLKSKIVYGP